MKKTLTTLFAVSLALLVLGQTALAIPAFARKHAFNCNMCHVGFPKLNDFGQRFRDNGYQIPGQQGREKTVFETAFPLALRTTTGYSLYGTEGQSAGGFHVYNLDLLSGGVLNKNISYLFIYRAPVLLGDERAKSGFKGLRTEKLGNAVRLEDVRHATFGPDELMRGRVVYPEKLQVDETTFSLG